MKEYLEPNALDARAERLLAQIAGAPRLDEAYLLIVDAGDVVERLLDAWRAARLAARGREAFTIADLDKAVEAAIARRMDP